MRHAGVKLKQKKAVAKPPLSTGHNNTGSVSYRCHADAAACGTPYRPLAR